MDEREKSRGVGALDSGIFPKRRTKQSLTPANPPAPNETRTVYGWGEAPAHLKTRNQLAEEGLRPGRGVQPVARIEWKEGQKWADLFPVDQAVPKRKASPAQMAAMAARQAKACICPHCGADFLHPLPRSWSEDDCFGCAIKNAAARAEYILASNPLFLDFETTTLGGFAVELAMVDAEGNVLFDQRMNPQAPIDPEATAIHGIRDEDVRDLPTFAEYHPKIRELLKGRLVVAYNASFDRGILRDELERIGAPPIKAKWECAMHLLMDYHMSKYPEKLGGNHSARGDCLLTRNLVQAIAKKDV